MPQDDVYLEIQCTEDGEVYFEMTTKERVLEDVKDEDPNDYITLDALVKTLSKRREYPFKKLLIKNPQVVTPTPKVVVKEYELK